MTNHLKTIFYLLIFASINVQAQISDTQVAALVEALRLAAPEGNLYSEWQVKPSNVENWSKRCLDKAITPDEFAANPTVARQVLECKMGNLLREQYELSEQNENIAVLRAASWWMTGIPENYASTPKLELFTNEVLKFYQQAITQ